MAECHRCRWDGQPSSPEKERACLACSLPEDYVNHKGKVFVSFESGPSVQTAAEVAAAKRAEEYAQGEPDIDPLDESDPVVRAAMELGALRAIQFFMDMDTSELSLLMMAMAQPLAETARQIKRTRQAVSIAFKKVVEKYPGMEAIIHSTGAARPRNPNSIRAGARATVGRA